MDKAAQARAEIESLLPRDVDIRFDEVFPNLTGWGARKRNRRKALLLAKSADVLRGALEEDEVVRHVSTGVRNLTWEALTIGWITYFLNRTTLVLTDRRLLAIHTNTSHEPCHYANQVALDHVKKTKSGWVFGFLNLKLGKGSLQYTRIEKADAVRFKQLMPGRPHAKGGVQHLCPACFLVTDDYGEVCGRCGAEFKDPKVAALRSLAMPGLGDWYLGHRGFALFELIGSTFGWLLFLLSLFAFLVAETPELREEGLVGVIVIGLAVGFAHFVDALITHAQAKKGQHSRDFLLPTRSARVPTPRAAAGGSLTPTGVR